MMLSVDDEPGWSLQVTWRVDGDDDVCDCLIRDVALGFLDHHSEEFLSDNKYEVSIISLHGLMSDHC
jgi:hypothetical protein